MILLEGGGGRGRGRAWLGSWSTAGMIGREEGGRE